LNSFFAEVLKTCFRPTEQDTVLDLEERSDDLPALMVWCDVVAKSEVFTSFIVNDCCSVSRIVRAVLWLVVKEWAGIKLSLRRKEKARMKINRRKKNSKLIIEL
jgi:hypothetical protein